MAKAPLQFSSQGSMKRTHKKTVTLNEREIAALNEYCKKYRVKNQSKFIRDAVFNNIFKTYSDDYPTLFDKKVMAALVQF